MSAQTPSTVARTVETIRLVSGRIAEDGIDPRLIFCFHRADWTIRLMIRPIYPELANGIRRYLYFCAEVA